MKCRKCFMEVDGFIHEGTGEVILFVKDNPNVLHKCIEQKYWCIGCDAPIPYRNPCVHRRIPINKEQPKGALDYYYE